MKSRNEAAEMHLTLMDSVNMVHCQQRTTSYVMFQGMMEMTSAQSKSVFSFSALSIISPEQDLVLTTDTDTCCPRSHDIHPEPQLDDLSVRFEDLSGVFFGLI